MNMEILGLFMGSETKKQKNKKKNWLEKEN